MKLIQFINVISLVLSFRGFGMIYMLLLLFISLFEVVDGSEDVGCILMIWMHERNWGRLERKKRMFVGERCSGCGCRLERFKISNVSNLVIDGIVFQQSYNKSR
jgi:hypothetical protein